MMAAGSVRSPEVSPRRRAAGWRRWGGWVAGLAVAAAAAAVLHLHRPQGQFFFPRCTFHAATGLWCPGCGGLRALHELLNGEFRAAARSNALLVVGVPVAAAVWWGVRRWAGTRAGVSSRLVWIGFLAVAAFSVLRNLPGLPFEWLAPLP